MAATTEQKKQDLVARLQKTPIVQVACERAEVSRASYYRWCREDQTFAKAVEHAIQFGRYLINDLAESRLIKKIGEDNMTAIIFWLKNNHQGYTDKMIYKHQFSIKPELTPEEGKEIAEAAIRMGLASTIVQDDDEAKKIIKWSAAKQKRREKEFIKKMMGTDPQARTETMEEEETEEKKPPVRNNKKGVKIKDFLKHLDERKESL